VGRLPLTAKIRVIQLFDNLPIFLSVIAHPRKLHPEKVLDSASANEAEETGQ
jgi:hypothetical protein